MTQQHGSRDYESLDRYLKTVFALIEGSADVEEAFHCLLTYLEWNRRNRRKPELEPFLIELFFDKCRKEFTDPEPQE